MPAKSAPKPAVKKAPAPKKDNKDNSKKAAPQKPAAKKAPAPKKAEPKAVKPAAPQNISNGVYAKGWGQGNLEECKKVFSAVGNIVDARIRRNKYALVFYENAVAVKKACETFNNMEVAGAILSVIPAKTSPKPDAHKDTKVVFVAPLMQESTTSKAVFNFFADCGKIAKLRIYHNNTGFVYFETAEAAQKAIKDKDGQEFHQHKLSVHPSTRSLEADKKRSEKAKLAVTIHQWKLAQKTH